MTTGMKDFFISYNKADRAWALWIDSTLTAAGFTTVVQDLDFKAGGNFVLEMDRATKECERTIAVISQNYLDAEFTMPEWAARFAADPKGTGGKLVPVRVAECSIDGLLAQIIYCDLVGVDEETARKRLLSQLIPGRTEPAETPSFPGRAAARSTREPRTPTPITSHQLWTPLRQPVGVQWRADGTYLSGSRSTLQLQTIPVDGRPIEARALRGLPDALASMARASGLFDQDEALQMQTLEDHVVVSAAGAADSKGMAAYRDRHVVTWLPLPHAMLGSVFDEEDIKNRLIASLALHADTGLLDRTEVALAVSIEPIQSLVVGKAGDIQRQSSLQLLFTMTPNSSLRIEPEATVAAADLSSYGVPIAEELTARLALRIASLR